MSKLYDDFGTDVQFFLIYCREAHPVDGKNPGGRTLVEDPLTDAERRGVAVQFLEDLKLKTPALLDGVDDAVGKAYASHPDRLYLVGADGRIAFAGERGPFGFEPIQLREAIEDELLRIDTTKPDQPQKKTAPTSLIEMLDTDGDGVLSKDEVANASKVLRLLDKNSDGSISKEELPGKK